MAPWLTPQRYPAYDNIIKPAHVSIASEKVRTLPRLHVQHLGTGDSVQRVSANEAVPGGCSVVIGLAEGGKLLAMTAAARRRLILTILNIGLS